MSSIPEEMYHEILLRLPVKSLLICKSVCKTWYALISTSDFIEFHLHFATHKNNPMLMLQSSTRVLQSIGYDSLASSVCEFEDVAIEMDYPFKSLHHSVRLMGACNGLVCIRFSEYTSGRDFFCIWNPATREYKELPKSLNKSQDKTIFICALVHDHKNDDYKFAVGVGDRGTQDSTLVQVYTLASNSWKPWQTIPYRFAICMQRNGVLFNGELHWLGIAQDKFFLLSLDISSETFKELLLLPKELQERIKNPGMSMMLGVLEECLCVHIDSYVNDIKIHCEVWKMLDYGVQESWTRQYITHESIIRNHIVFRSLLWSFTNGKILFMNAGSLVSYDPEHGSARELGNVCVLNSLVVNYIESLVSLHSGTYVGGEGQIEESRET